MLRSKKSNLSNKQSKLRRSHFPSLSVLTSMSNKIKQVNTNDISYESPAESLFLDSNSVSIIPSITTLTQNPSIFIPSTVKYFSQHKDLSSDLNTFKDKKRIRARSKQGVVKETFSCPDSLLIARNALKKFGLTEEVFKLYDEAFLKFTKQEKVKGSYLGEIREVFNEWVLHNSKSSLESLQREISSLNQELQTKLNENNKTLQELEEKKKEIINNTKILQNLCNENLELGQKVKEISRNYQEIRSKFVSISKVSLDHVPTDPESWKALITGNQEYANLCKKLNQRVESLEKREKNLLDMLRAIKKSGIQGERFDDLSFEEVNGRIFKSHDKKILSWVPKID